MLIIHCPYCGDRPELEFVHAGQAHLLRAADSAIHSDAELSAYLYERSNVKGVQAERWRHVRGCARFFNALRDTTTDQFVATYKSGAPRP